MSNIGFIVALAILANVAHSVTERAIWINMLEVKRNYYRLERAQGTVLLKEASRYVQDDLKGGVQQINILPINCA